MQSKDDLNCYKILLRTRRGTRKMPEIIYSDTSITVVNKKNAEDSERLAESLGLFPCHRLDRTTSGLLLLANGKKAAAFLCAPGRIKKTYTAVVEGTLENDSGRLEDLLWHDAKRNKSFVVKRERAGVKRAALEYRVTARLENCTAVEIKLLTGRTHQIRVQFANIGHPVRGDRRYGAKIGGDIALRCSKLEFTHPESGGKVSFYI